MRTRCRHSATDSKKRAPVPDSLRMTIELVVAPPAKYLPGHTACDVQQSVSFHDRPSFGSKSLLMACKRLMHM